MVQGISESYPSLVTRNESAFIKGVYMLLIILGHNYIFTNSTSRLEIMQYMYMFHIAGFFMLPYLYGSRGLSWNGIENHAVRLLWPFLILATVFYVGYYILVGRHSFDIADYAKVIFVGDGTTLSHYCGFQVLWFLPTMFLTMIIHDFYFYNRKIFGGIIIVMGLLLAVGILIPTIGWIKQYNMIIYSLPWEFWTAILYSLYGIICREILIRTFRHKLLIEGLCCVVAVWVSIMYFNDIPGWQNPVAGNRWGRILYPVAFMIPVVLASPKLCRFNWLRWLGENSLLIYLIHPFIGFIIMYFFPTIYVNPPVVQVAAILISFAVILGSTVLMTMLIKRCTPIYSFLFPRNVEQWCKLWQRK